MKAVQYNEFGGPEVLKIVELPDPHPGPGQIRVTVRAVGINPIDWKQRKGGPMSGELPQTTGRDVAGVVDKLGEGVSDVALGDRVFGLAVGSTAAAELALLADYAPIRPSISRMRPPCPSRSRRLPAALSCST
jgi:NADPH:quinone reductase-like Zn-dependent oxidoreductase